MSHLLEATVLLIIFTLIASMFTLISLLEYFAWKHRKSSTAINDILGKLPKYLPIAYGDEDKPHHIGCVNMLANALLALISLIVWGFMMIDMVIAVIMTEGTEQVTNLVLVMLSALVIFLSFYFPMYHARRYKQPAAKINTPN